MAKGDGPWRLPDGPRAWQTGPLATRGQRTRGRVMRRLLGGIAAVLVASQVVHARGPVEASKTAAYVSALQKPDGGFSASEGRNFQPGDDLLGDPRPQERPEARSRDVPGCLAYVLSCRDEETGGFAPTPGGRPSVGVTASGLMALAELKVKDRAILDGAVELSRRECQRVRGDPHRRRGDGGRPEDLAGLQGLVGAGRGRPQRRRHLRQGGRHGPRHRVGGRRAACGWAPISTTRRKSWAS